MDVEPRLRGRRILLVEDDPLVAMILSDFLEEAGAEVVGPIDNIDAAVAYVMENSAAIDGAVVDLNLNGQRSYPVADVLSAHQVKFAFSSGYSSDSVDEAYRHYPMCQKPVTQSALIDALDV